MKRTLLYFGSALVSLTSVFAGNYPSGDMGSGMMGGNMMGCGMKEGMYQHGSWMGILFFIAGTFIASLIFWLTHRWVMSYQPKKKR